PSRRCGYPSASYLELNSQLLSHYRRLSNRCATPIFRPEQEPNHRVTLMPLALFALTIAAYAIGTTEFVIVGLLPTVASDLHITLPLAGLIVMVYALGVTSRAPI